MLTWGGISGNMIKVYFAKLQHLWTEEEPVILLGTCFCCCIAPLSGNAIVFYGLVWKICLSLSDGNPSCDTITQSCVFFLLRNHEVTCGKSKFHEVSARCDLFWRRHETTDVESHHAVVFWALARELKAADGRKVISAEIVPDEEQLVATFPSAAASAATY